MKRARALKRKQSAGDFAPPSDSSPARSQGDSTARGMSVFMSPARPLGRETAASSSLGLALEAHKEVGPSPLSAPVAALPNGTSSSAVPAAEERVDASTTSDLPHEVDDNDTHTTEPRMSKSATNTDSPSTPEQSFNADADTSHITPLLPGPASLSFAGKVKGLIFSYLPRAVRPTPTSSKVSQSTEHRGLPLPPPEVLHKPRGPITTPAPKPIPKAAAPRELVKLHPVSAKPSMIPRPIPSQKARQWVDLHPVPARPATSLGVYPSLPPRDRRVSTASVRDLVHSFESMSEIQAAERESTRQLELRRKRSVQEWTKTRAGTSKPVWKP